MSSNKKYKLDPFTLRLVEDKKSFAHYFFIIALIIFSASILTTVAIFFFGDIIESQYTRSLKIENEALRAQIGKYTERVTTINQVIKNLSERDEQIRGLIDLPSIDSDLRMAGVGGGIYEELITGDFDTDRILNVTNDALSQIDRQLAIQKDSYEEILEKYRLNKKYFDNFPAIKPIQGRLSSSFGMRNHPIYKIRRPHNGIDITTPRGTPVYATGGGTIIFAGGNPRTGFGRLVIIDHGFGLKTYYAHLTNTKVKVGQKVKRGDTIAYSGNTGVSTAPHLHYEVHFRGKPQDPVMYFLDDLDPVEYNIAIHGADKDRPSLD